MKQLPPELRELYGNEQMVVEVAKAYPYYRMLIEALLRNQVSESNLNTIAPTQLAGHTLLRGCSLFADRGRVLLDEVKNAQEKQKQNNT